MCKQRRSLSLRIDAIHKAIDQAQSWPESETKRAALRVLRKRLSQLHRRVTA
jgi:hypothetical protein